ncbi:MAG: magnesium/cobalt transporter CorA [Cetobacterium sp.]|uniref:magnesium/cobalt transporter CorA n=1 Tax=Cetobacterium sp. TaxID=2071632 RepID=UPI003EE6EE20
MQLKTGLQPGTLIYTGLKNKYDAIEIDEVIYNKENISNKITIYNDKLTINPNGEMNNWLTITGIHDIELVKSIGDIFNIDSLILEDIVSNTQRPKLEVRENLIFIVLKLIIPENDGEFKYEQISLTLLENTLIVFQESKHSIFNNIKNRVLKDIGRLRKKGVGYLTYGILDRIIDNYFLILESLNNRIDELEEQILLSPTKDDFERILTLKKDILKLKKSLHPLKEVIISLKSNKIKEYLNEDIDIYLEDLHDHINVALENIDNLFLKGNELIQLYHTTVSSGMNEIMKVLTMISTTFIPLSFLVGLYGMNFEVIPELKWEYGYFILLFIMFMVICGIGYFFKKKKWW